jgi:hypothetical protein
VDKHSPFLIFLEESFTMMFGVQQMEIVGQNSPTDAGWHPRGQIEGNFVRNDTLWLIGGGTYDARHMYSDVWNTSDGINWNNVTEAANFTPTTIP